MTSYFSIFLYSRKFHAKREIDVDFLAVAFEMRTGKLCFSKRVMQDEVRISLF